MKFNSQICTTREQSERLLSLGLKKETADMMHYKSASMKEWGVLATQFTKECEGCKCYFPAWSLHRLIEMMPITLKEDRVYHECWDLNVTPTVVIYRNQDQPWEWIGECLGQGMYNNVIDCIEWLIKEGYFNKKYLEEHCLDEEE